MVSFLRICDRIKEDKETLPDTPNIDTLNGHGDSPLLNTGEDTKSMEVIRSGLGLDKNFWENFIKICNNDGLSDLLNIKSHQIGEWVPRIRTALKRVEEADRGKKKDKMIKTGDSFPKTAGNEDGAITYPQDTNPTP